MTRNRLIVIGHAALDFVYRIDAFPPRPVKMRAREHITTGGGMAANAASAAARLGADVALWSRIGSDHAGRLILEELRLMGVDTSSVRQHPGARTATGPSSSTPRANVSLSAKTTTVCPRLRTGFRSPPLLAPEPS